MSEAVYTTYDETTRDAVLDLVRTRLSSEAAHAVAHLLQNPDRQTRSAAGDVVLLNGKAVCFQGLIARRVYLNQEVFAGHAGSTFVKAEKGCPAEALLQVINLERSNAGLSDLAMGNTCIYRVAALSRALGKKEGPSSWRSVRIAVLNPFLFAALMFWRKVLKRAQPDVPPLSATQPTRTYARLRTWSVQRLTQLDAAELDSFWRRYLAENRGLVLSRTAAELEWLFGAGIRKGTTAFLALRNNKAIEGYIVMRRMTDSPRRWQVLDWIALNNDPARLDLLLVAARRFLRRAAGAITLEATGFPDRVQPLLKRRLPFQRKLGHNPFVWRTPRAETAERISAALNAQDGWFFGPYDGDYGL